MKENESLYILGLITLMILFVLYLSNEDFFYFVNNSIDYFKNKDNKTKITIEIENADINLIEDAIYQFQE